MAAYLHSTNTKELLKQHQYTDTFPNITACKEQVTIIQNHHGSYKDIYFEGVHIGYGNAQLAHKSSFRIEPTSETIALHFKLATDYCEVFNIHLHAGIFKRYIQADGSAVDSFRQLIQSASIFYQEYPAITFEMHQIIHDIIHCQRRGLFKIIFLKVKAIELLLLQLEQLTAEQELQQTALKQSEIKKLYAARDYLSQHMSEPCTLVELAHHVGTNEFTLKKGFKQLFGTTVFAYWNHIKMEYACKMLSKKEMNISQIAESVGYKNPQHFSAAFKRKYGYTPSKLKH